MKGNGQIACKFCTDYANICTMHKTSGSARVTNPMDCRNAVFWPPTYYDLNRIIIQIVVTSKGKIAMGQRPRRL